MREAEDCLLFEDALDSLLPFGKSIKLDLKETGNLIENVLVMLHRRRVRSADLWFNGKVHVLKQEGFRELVSAVPHAVVQCPIDFLTPLILGVPEKAGETLMLLHEWGVNRFSVGWEIPGMHKLLNQLDQWNLDVNIDNVPDLESFLKAVLLRPTSITADFHFPQGHYFGRGSWQNFEHDERFMR